MGLTFGAGLQAVILLPMLVRWDWGQEAARVQRRMAEAAARRSKGEGGPPGGLLVPAH